MTRTKRAAPLPVSFFRRPAEVVAHDLVGAVLISTIRGVRTAGRIVEVEAYLGRADPASHGYQDRRHAQNEGLYGPAGSWYVYLSYGVHWCANLVAGRMPNEGAVLLRAIEPLEGLPAMRRRRGGVSTDRLLAAGPGRLTQALGITRSLDRQPMRGATVQVFRGVAGGVVTAPRIGITKAVDWPLRFVDAGTRWASRPVPSPGGRGGRG